LDVPFLTSPQNNAIFAFGKQKSAVMYLAIKNVQPTSNYQLILTFENGEKRQFDMNPYLGLGIFKNCAMY